MGFTTNRVTKIGNVEHVGGLNDSGNTEKNTGKKVYPESDRYINVGKKPKDVDKRIKISRG